jgi:hypothetical protein
MLPHFVIEQNTHKSESTRIYMTPFYDNKQTNEFRGFSPRTNYTDLATAICRRSQCKLFIIGVLRGERNGSLQPYSRFYRPKPLLFLPSSSSIAQTHNFSENMVAPGIEPGTPGYVARNSGH